MQEDWEIPGSAGQTLSGTTFLPDAESPPPVLLLIHGSGEINRDGNQPPQVMSGYFRQLADTLATRGIGSIRYDKRTSQLGKDTLAAAGFRFRHLVDDVDSILAHFTRDKRVGPIFLLGHSQGALLMSLADQNRVKALISVCGTARTFDQLLIRQTCAKDSLSCKPVTDLMDKARAYKGEDPSMADANMRFLRDYMGYDPLDVASGITRPVLVVGGGMDLQVPESEASELDAAYPDSELHIFDSMNHVMKSVSSEGENIHSYIVPDYPLHPGFVQALVRFVREHGGL